MQVHTKCKRFLAINFPLCVSVIAATWDHAFHLIVLVCANSGFSLCAMGYHVKCIIRIKTLERLSSSLLALRSVEGNPFLVLLWTKSLYDKYSLKNGKTH